MSISSNIHFPSPAPALVSAPTTAALLRQGRAGSKFEPQVGYLINSAAQLIIVDTAPTI